MKVNDVLKLVTAGFTATQIAAMAGEQTEPKQTEPKQTEPKQTEPKQAEPKQAEPTISDLMAEIGALKADMQKMALLNTQQKREESSSVDDILAAIINPPQKGEK